MDNGARAIGQRLAPGEVVKVFDGCATSFSSSAAATRWWMTSWFAEAKRPASSIESQYSWPASLAQREPGQMAQRRIQQRMLARRQLGIGVGDLEADAARAAVREQRQILARLQAKLLVVGVEAEDAPLDEVVARARCAKLVAAP